MSLRSPELCCDFLKLIRTLSASYQVIESDDGVGSDTKRSQRSIFILVNDIYVYRMLFQVCSGGFRYVLP
jgi:hypothetical protein